MLVLTSVTQINLILKKKRKINKQTYTTYEITDSGTLWLVGRSVGFKFKEKTSHINVAKTVSLSSIGTFVLVGSRCRNKISQIRGLKQQAFLTAPEAGSPRSGCRCGVVLACR